MTVRARVLTSVVLAALLAGCSAEDEGSRTTDNGPVSTASISPTDEPAPGDPETTVPAPEAEEQQPAVRPVSVLGLAEHRFEGDQLRLGAVRERTAAHTSYDVTYRSRTTYRQRAESYSISGVLNVPNGRGPFPAVVLAHGYIDPAIYVRGQGMTRERGYLAARGTSPSMSTTATMRSPTTTRSQGSGCGWGTAPTC